MSNFNPSDDDLAKEISSRIAKDYPESQLLRHFLTLVYKLYGELFELLAKCRLFVYGKDLLINCPQENIAIELWQNREFMAHLAKSLAFKRIVIMQGGGNWLINSRYSSSFNPTIEKKNIEIMLTENRPDRDLFIELEDSNMSAAITSQAADGPFKIQAKHEEKILYCNRAIEASTGIPSYEWIGRRADELWIPSELEKLYKYLELDRELRDYHYQALRAIDGSIADFCGHFKWVIFRGIPCRVWWGVS
jgi:PAS domain-containing protein